MKLRNIGVLAAGAMVAISACGPGGTPAPSTPTGTTPPASTPAETTAGGTIDTVNFAIELPQQGSEKAASDPIINGIKLAVKDAGGSAGGIAIEIPNSVIFDDALNGVHDPQTGANNMNQIVAIPEIVGVIGPLNSNVGAAQIPISNAAGLAQCSPANTNPDLTKGDAAAQIRTKPNNYIRVVTTDDVQGPAAAQYTYETLGAQSVYIIDDTEIFGKGVADTYEEAFLAFGGEVVKRDGAPRTTQDYNSLMTAAAALEPEAIFFGGVTASGGARIFQAAQQAGLADIPYVGPDGINDGDAATPDSFLNLAGDAAEGNAFSTLAGIGTFEGKEEFDAHYEDEYGIAATGYAAQGYTCAQIFIDALERAAATNPADLAALREAMRVAITDTSVTYETVQGDITFDANGDTSQLIVSIYSVEAGSWAFETQVDYATAQ